VHCRLLERVFRVPVFNLYGSTETGHLLMEDEHGSMRPSAATAFLETVDPDTQGIGHLVVTTLTNDYMPLVRYRIGDLVEPVHRSGNLAFVVHGRARDTLRDSAGRRITTWHVDQCFAEVDGLAHYELRQADDGCCRLRYVPDRERPSASALAGLKGGLESLLRLRCPLTVEAVETLVPAPSGKFRLTCRE
jgi:phenylacetate-CoA ligase